MKAREIQIFERERPRLRAAAFRMLGSVAEADDAVQETWRRYQYVHRAWLADRRTWLLTALGRICLDLLRARRFLDEDAAEFELLAAATGLPANREVPAAPGELAATGTEAPESADEAVLAESVGRTILGALSRLEPAERVAFVLHDLFAVPFDEIAPVIGHTPVKTKELVGVARHHAQGSAFASGD